MTEDLVIRPPRTGDGEGVARVWADMGAYYAALAPDLFREPDAAGLAEWCEGWVTALRTDDKLLLVAERGGSVVGFVLGTVARPGADAHRQLVAEMTQVRLIVDALAVHRAAWRRGAGTALMEAAEAWGRERGVAVAQLDTWADSPVSVPFYEHGMGYERRAFRMQKALADSPPAVRRTPDGGGSVASPGRTGADDPALPAVRSILDGDALGCRIERAYDLGPVRECRFFVLGLNDTYAVRTAGARYMLRLYRHRWRSADEVAYEVDALLHLEGRGVPVAAPVPRTDGGFVGEMGTPEGPRMAVLFRHAPGHERFAAPEDATDYGAALARIHAATDGFGSRHARFSLDAGHLVEGPSRLLRPFLAHRPADAAFLDRLVRRLGDGLAALAGAGLDRGFCHGDAHGGNAHRADDGTVTFFDFDCCGAGWRAYDAAVFRWQQEWHRRAETHWTAFLDGYRSVRTFSDGDEAATPLLVAVRELWLLGVHAGHGPDRGFGWNALNDDYLDGRVGFLRRWAGEHLGIVGAGTGREGR